MKLHLLILPLLLAVATISPAQTSPTETKHLTQSTPTTLSKAKRVISALKEELLGSQSEVVETKKSLEEAMFNLEATNTLVLDLNTQIISLGKDRDTGWNTANDRLTKINKLEDKLGKVLFKVSIVASIVGLLFGAVAVLAALKFLGTASFLTGPYGFAYLSGAYLVSWGIGFFLTQYFFRT